VRFAFIAAEKASYPVMMLCRVLQVSRAGFYAWQKRAPAERTLKDQRLKLEVAAIFAHHRGRYGSPRVHAELRERGERAGRKRVARLMRMAGLRARGARRFRLTTDSNHALAITNNVLARRFAVAAPDRGWVADITYLWTHEGWLYLAVILDLYSRRVVGWALAERLERKLALDALRMALAQSAGRSLSASSASWRWTPCAWRWRSAVPEPDFCITRIVAANTPVVSIGNCSPNTRSRAA
jgi:putative transposase